MVKKIIAEMIEENETHITNTYLAVITKNGKVSTTSTLRYSESNIEELKNNIEIKHLLNKFKESIGEHEGKNLELNYPKKSSLKRPKNIFLTLIDEPSPTTSLIACELAEFPTNYTLETDYENGDLVVIVTAKLSKVKTKKELEDNITTENLLTFSLVSDIKNGNIKATSDQMSLDEFLGRVENHAIATDVGVRKETHLTNLTSRLVRLKSNVATWQSLYVFEGE